jgi:hypothetical protein
MGLVKHRIAAAVAVISLASLVTFLQVKANHETDDQFGEDAVWNAATDELGEINRACNNSGPAEYGRCFIDQMGDYASSEAVEFSQSLAEKKPSRVGYLAGIREAGLVDLGYVVYPGSSKPDRGWVLLNGVPSLVNVDDPSLLPQAEMEKDPRFIALRKDHPQIKLAVRDDQRTPDASPKIETRADGGERFIFSYSLQDCPDCAPLAQATFGFDFDAAGELLAAKFISVSKTQ